MPRYLLLNGDRQDAFWRMATKAFGLAVTELDVYADDPNAINRWSVPTVPCVVEVEADKAVFIATTMDQVQNFDAAKQAYLDRLAAEEAERQRIAAEEAAKAEAAAV